MSYSIFKEFDLLMTSRVRLPPGYKWQHAKIDFEKNFFSLHPTAQWWFKKFHASDKSLEDDERSGQPSDVDNDQLRALVKANTCRTV